MFFKENENCILVKFLCCDQKNEEVSRTVFIKKDRDFVIKSHTDILTVIANAQSCESYKCFYVGSIPDSIKNYSHTVLNKWLKPTFVELSLIKNTVGGNKIIAIEFLAELK